MKKMQCEVCGSTDIKKVSDDMFECQSCGVQYGKDEAKKLLVEIKGEVKIDHSDEIEKLLIRAKQFWEKGDFTKALEYCNKVLDLDPNEKSALHMVNSVNNERHKKQQSSLSSIKIIKHTVEPDKALTYFLHALKNVPDITPDIYKELEIMSTSQGYYPFTVIDKQFDCSYEGVACYRRKVPYTDYETKTDYSNKNQDGSYKKIQVAVTKYREEIERQPVNGSFFAENMGAFSTSKSLNEIITTIPPEEYDAAVEDDAYFDKIINANMQRSKYKDALIQKIERYVTNLFSSAQSTIETVSSSEQKEINGIKINIDSINCNWENRANNVFEEKAKEIIGQKADEAIPGDFTENTRYRWSEKYCNIQTIYIPLQIIEYAYRGKFYVSAMILNQTENLLISYPCNTEIKTAKSKTEQAVSKIKKKEFPVGILILYSLMAAGVITPIWIEITEGGIEAGFFWAFFSIWFGLFGVPAILWNILWCKKKNKEMRTELMQGTEIINNIENTYKSELEAEFNAFFKEFKGTNTIELSTLAAKNSSSFNANISSIKGRIFIAHAEKSNNAAYKNNTVNGNEETLFDSKGRELTSQDKYSIFLTDCGANKIAVIKVIREMYGLGLASAKEIADKPRALIDSGIDYSKAKSVALILKSAGATIEIDKED